MFADKLKSLRAEKGLTQEALAEQLYVTRAAVSKWENGKGYPNIESLRQISRLFHVTVDELISDGDAENQHRLEDRRTKRYFWCAMACLLMTVLSALGVFLGGLPLGLLTALGTVGYVVFAFLSKPKYRRMQLKKYVWAYVLSRAVVLAIVLAAAIALLRSL